MCDSFRPGMNASHQRPHMIDSHTCASRSLAEKLIVCITRRQPPPTYCPCWTDNGGPLHYRWGLNTLLNTQLLCLASLYCSFSSLLSFSLSLCYIPPVLLTNYWNHKEKPTWVCAPCGQAGRDTNDHFVLCESLNLETLTTRSDAVATSLHLRTAALLRLCLDDADFPLRQTDRQTETLWLHLSWTFLFPGRSENRLQLITLIRILRIRTGHFFS